MNEFREGRRSPSRRSPSNSSGRGSGARPCAAAGEPERSPPHSRPCPRPPAGKEKNRHPPPHTHPPAPKAGWGGGGGGNGWGCAPARPSAPQDPRCGLAAASSSRRLPPWYRREKERWKEAAGPAPPGLAAHSPQRQGRGASHPAEVRARKAGGGPRG